MHVVRTPTAAQFESNESVALNVWYALNVIVVVVLDVMFTYSLKTVVIETCEVWWSLNEIIKRYHYEKCVVLTLINHFVQNLVIKNHSQKVHPKLVSIIVLFCIMTWLQILWRMNSTVTENVKHIILRCELLEINSKGNNHKQINK